MGEVQQKKEEKDSSVFLFDNKVKVWFPDIFYEDSELIEKRYPFKNKPSIIKVDNTGKVFITFDLFSKPLSTLQISGAAVSIRNILLQVYSYNNKIKLKRFKTIQGLDGVSFSFYIVNRCGRQFIEFFVLSIQGQLFMSTLTCPEENRYKWNSVFLKMKRNVQEVEKNQKELVQKKRCLYDNEW
ncbi:MAG: hypothetical protein HDR12_06800 [Lachnospiraceae bacterium]|nr:hypothetical protein [Lachnospiraceae bacterium]